MKHILILFLLSPIFIFGQPLSNLQRGTARDQIPVTNGVFNTQVYRDAIPYILDTLGVRDSLNYCPFIFNCDKGGPFEECDTEGAKCGDFAYHENQLYVYDGVDWVLLIENQRIFRLADYISKDSIPDPRKYDIYVDDGYQMSYYYDGTDWQLFSADNDPFNEGEVSYQNIGVDSVGLIYSQNFLKLHRYLGLWGVNISSNEIDRITWAVDSTQVATKYDLTLITSTPDSIYIQSDTIRLRDGSGFVNLTPYVNTDSQALTIDSSGRIFNLSISGGNTVAWKDSVGITGAGAANKLAIWNSASTLTLNNNLGYTSGGNFHVGTTSGAYRVTSVAEDYAAYIGNAASTRGLWVVPESSNPWTVEVLGNTKLSGTILNSSGSAGSSGQVLTSQGSGNWTWTTPTTGTVTSVGLTTGTSGTDINVTGSPVTGAGSFTLNIPTASASNRGALSSADWTTFNNKVGGNGSANKLAFWSSSNALSSNSNFHVDNANSRLYIGGSTTGGIGHLNVTGQAGNGYSTPFNITSSWLNTWIKSYVFNDLNQRGVSIGGSSTGDTNYDHLLVLNHFSAPGVGIKTQYPLADLHITTPYAGGSNNGIRLDHNSSIQSLRQINAEGDIIFRSTTGHMSVGPLSTVIQDLNPAANLHLFAPGGFGEDEQFRIERAGGWGYTSFNMYVRTGGFKGIKLRDSYGGASILTTEQINKRVGIIQEEPAQTLDVNGTCRITGSTGIATSVVGRNAAGDISNMTLSAGLTISGGQLTVADQSSTNELQAYSHSGTTSYTNTLSSGGGSFTLNAGSGISLSHSAGTTTISATGGVTGSGTATQVAYWSGTSSLAGNSNLYWNNSQVRLGIGSATPVTTLEVLSPSGAYTSTKGILSTHGSSSYGLMMNHAGASTYQLSFGTAANTYNYLGNSGLYFDGANDRIGVKANTPTRDLDVNGEVRIRDLVTTTPTRIVSADADGVLSSLGLSGLTISGGNLTAVDASATNELQNLSYTAATGALGISSGSGVTLPVATSTVRGLVPTPPNNTTQFLRGDATWATPTTTLSGGQSPRMAYWTSASTLSNTAGMNWDNSNGRLSIGWIGTPPDQLSLTGNINVQTRSNSTPSFIAGWTASNQASNISWGEDMAMDGSTLQLVKRYGQMTRKTGVQWAIPSSLTKVDFDGFVSNNISADIGNDWITVPISGLYRVVFNATIGGAATRNVGTYIYASTTGNTQIVASLQSQSHSSNGFDAFHYEEIHQFNINERINIRASYDTGSGSGTDIYFIYPRFSIEKL